MIQRTAILSYIVMFLVLFSTLLLAQPSSPTPTADPNGKPIYPQEEESAPSAAELAWLEFYANRTIFDFRVAYLIEKDVDVDELVAPETFREYMGAVVVHSWDEFLNQNNAYPFHIVLIHGSMLDNVDPMWFREAYRNRIIIMGFNMRTAQMAALIDDGCIKSPAKSLLDQTDNIFVGTNFIVEAESESIRDFVIQSELETCSKNYKGLGVITLRNGIGETPLFSLGAVQYLANDLAFQTARYGIAKPDTLPLPQENFGD